MFNNSLPILFGSLLRFPLLQLRGGGKDDSGAGLSSSKDFAGPFPLRRPAGVGEGGWPGNCHVDVCRLDWVVSRSMVCRTRGMTAYVRVRMKVAVSSPCRLVFLSLLVGRGGATGRTSFLLLGIGNGGASERIFVPP